MVRAIQVYVLILNTSTRGAANVGFIYATGAPVFQFRRSITSDKAARQQRSVISQSFSGETRSQLMHAIRLDFEEGDFRRRYSHSQVDESFYTPSRLLLFRPTYLTTTSKEYQLSISWPQECGVSDDQY